MLGEVTEDKLKIVRESDAILRDEIAKAGLDNEIWQYFTALPDMKSVGVMGDARTYSYTVGIRAVTSIDGMTADWARIPWDILEKIRFDRERGRQRQPDRLRHYVEAAGDD